MRLPSIDTGKAKRFAPAAGRVHAERVLRIQGYSDLKSVRPAIVRAAEAMVELGPKLSKPSVAYRLVPICTIDKGVLELEGGFRFHCRAFERTLHGCTAVAAFVLTVGPELDERVVELVNSGELLEALLLETTGWLCIEDATRQFKLHLRDEMLAEGCRITSRLGPGYSYRVDQETCTWGLEEQQCLFATFGNAELPVALMASCAMQPKMSRSGLFGVTPLPSANLEPAVDALTAVPAA